MRPARVYAPTREVADALARDGSPELQPLGRLVVATSIHKDTCTEKGTKTGIARQVPVLPALAKVLAGWRRAGFHAYVGHAPGEDDYVIPTAEGRPRSVRKAHPALQRDLKTLGSASAASRHAADLHLAPARRRRPRSDPPMDHARRVEGVDDGRLLDARVVDPLRRGAAAPNPRGTATGAPRGRRVTQKRRKPNQRLLTRLPYAKSSCQGLLLANQAGWTGLEPAASGVTGRRYNRLNYHPTVGT